MNPLHILFAVLVFAALAHSQAVNVSGSVKDGAGQPVSGAEVTLQNAGLSTTTNAGGQFALVDEQSSLFPSEGKIGNMKASIREGMFLLDLKKPSLIQIRTYTSKGNLISYTENNLGAGSHRLKIPKSNGGIYFYKIKNPEGELQLSLNNSGLKNSGLAKAAAAADVLKVTKDGYQMVELELPDTDTSGLNIVLPEIVDLEPFSFFVTSLRAMQQLSGSQNGFGGDLSYGETGPDAGLRGADKICSEIAEMSMPGSSAKIWKAFLSAEDGGDGNPVHAIDRIGNGPWYDRFGRVVSQNKADLLNDRPASADPLIKEDLPNEDGNPNQNPDLTGTFDNHHVLTGSNGQGQLYTNHSYPSATCHNWTSSEPVIGTRPRIGFSWSIQNRIHWISGQDEGGCGAGIDVDGGGGSQPNNPIVGSGGGYGGIYCFALSP